MPPPVIEWVDGNGDIIADDRSTTTNEGRYLVLSDLTTALISRTYSCRVTNVRVHSTEASAGSYMLIDQGKLQSGSGMFLLLTGLVFSHMCTGATFPTDELVIYKELETEVTAFVGESVEVSFVSAIPKPFSHTYRLDGSTAGISTQVPFGRVDPVVSPSDGGFTYTIELTVLAASLDIPDPLRTTTLTVYGMLSD